MQRIVKRTLERVWPRQPFGHRILVYHSISEEPFSTPPEKFRAQMELLAERYPIVSLPELVGRLPGGPPSAAVTFDDGFEDNYTIAWPILRELGIFPTIFVTTFFVGDRSTVCRWSPYYNGARSMTWDQVRRLSDQGVTIGAHTRSHPRLADCGPEECVQELAAGRSDIARRIGVPVDLFAYPFGQHHDFTPASESTVAAAGFKYAFTTHQRTASPQDRPLAMPRITIDAHDSPADFIAKIEGRRNFMACVDTCRAAAVRIGLRQPLARACTRCTPPL